MYVYFGMGWGLGVGGSVDQSGRCRDRGGAPGPTAGLERSLQRLITRQNASDVPKREREELHVSASFTEHMHVCVCMCERQQMGIAHT